MGCGASKSGEGTFVNLCKSGEGGFVNLCKSEGCLVSLCKERKDLIRAARDSRNAVSASHVLYLQSLLDFGEALDVFLKEVEVVVASFDSPSGSSEVDSPLHSIDGSHLELSSVDSESVFLGSLTDEVHQGEKDGKTKLSSQKDSVDSYENESQILKTVNVHRIMRSSPEVVTELHDPASFGVEYIQPMHYYPAQNNYWFPADAARAHPGGTANTYNYNGYNFSDYWDGSFSSYPAKSSAQGQRFGNNGSERPMGYFRDMRQDYHPNEPPKPNPIPSPPMGNSTMDYFNFFSFTDDFYSSSYSRNIFDDGLGSEYPGLNYVLEEEGIPPLEEIEEDSPNEPFNMFKDVRDTQLDENGGTSEAQPVESDEGHMAGGEEMNHVNTSVEKDDNVASTLLITDSGEQEVGTNDAGNDKIIDEAEHSNKLKQVIRLKRPVIDIFEAIQEINHAFLTAYNSGKEVTEILEAEKIPYLPTGSALKGFYHIILGAIVPSTVSLQTSYMHRKKSAGKILKKTTHGSSYMVNDISYRHGMTNSTLDKLYMWEKKLYKEVKIEEDLRAVYDKLCKRSKILVNKGAEPDKIEVVQLKIKRLLPKIDVSVSAVRAISRHIYQARDEELHPQISGLIHGLSRMWKSMSQCHRNQVQVAVDAKKQHTVAKIALHLDMKHTEDLKLKVLKWRSCLCDLINTQRAFATFLVEWLSKFRREVKEDEDGVHLSSSPRTEDPDVALLCCGWLHALETSTVSRASEALEEFALALHNLWVKQNEEQALKLRMEFLEGRIYASTRYMESHQQTGSAQELNTARKYLEELKAAHAEVFDQVKIVASGCLTDGLVKVLGALESICTDMSYAYDQIRVS